MSIKNDHLQTMNHSNKVAPVDTGVPSRSAKSIQFASEVEDNTFGGSKDILYNFSCDCF